MCWSTFEVELFCLSAAYSATIVLSKKKKKSHLMKAEAAACRFQAQEGTGAHLTEGPLCKI